MTMYGWAVAVILIVGVVLWQTGMFAPTGSPTKGSRGFGQVRPGDWKCDSESGGVSVEWFNVAGERITVGATSGGCVYANRTYQIAFNVSEGEEFVCDYINDAGCAGISHGERFESVVTLSWRSNGPAHTESGSVWGPAE